MKKNSLKNPFFYILIRSWNSYQFLEKCLDSVLTQTYQNFKILFIDDASDYTKIQKDRLKHKLKKQVVIFNSKRKFSIYNAYFMIKNFALKKDSVILLLDGDDWLIGRDSLQYLSRIYSQKRNEVLWTYGTSFIWDGDKINTNIATKLSPYLNTSYPKRTIKNNLFRKEPFRVFHPMTFQTFLFHKIKESDFKEENGTWLKHCFDLTTFLPILEMTQAGYEFIRKPLYVYNISTSNLNTKINRFDFVREDLLIRKKNPYKPII